MLKKQDSPFYVKPSIVGFLLLVVLMLCLNFHLLDISLLFHDQASVRMWNLLSGAAVTCVVIWQLRLILIANHGSLKKRAQRVTHRWLGVLLIVLIALHATSTGFQYQRVFIGVLLLVMISGLCRDCLSQLYQYIPHVFWIRLHMVSVGLMLPLMLLHIWTALAFKG